MNPGNRPVGSSLPHGFTRALARSSNEAWDCSVTLPTVSLCKGCGKKQQWVPGITQRALPYMASQEL
eukprot:678167-Pelagomonas_calceolata.AAC.3